MFAIYLPGLSGYDPKHLERAGLGDLLDDQAPSFAEFLPGPDGGRGICATWEGRPFRCDELEWEKASGVRRQASGAVAPGEVWFGKLKGEKPKPAWFARPNMQLGADVTLADGQAWHIPIARELPCVLKLDDRGHWSGKVAPSYERFWDAAWATLDWLVPDEEGIAHVNFQTGADFASLALSINYRVNRDVVSWLGLIRSDLFWSVAKAVTEFDSLLAAQKKSGTADAGPVTSGGAAA